MSTSVGIPYWRSIAITVPYIALFVPCHYRCALGHSLGALLHLILLALLLVAMQSGFQTGETFTLIVTFLVASILANLLHIAVNLALSKFRVVSSEAMTATEVLAWYDDDSSSDREDKKPRAAAEENTTNTVAVLEASPADPKQLNIELLYEDTDEVSYVHPFETGLSDEQRNAENGSTAFSMDDFMAHQQKAFALFDDMDRDDYVPAFQRRSTTNVEERLAIALAAVQGEEHVEDVEDAALGIARAFEELDGLESPVEAAPAAVPLADPTRDPWEDPAAAVVFEMFQDDSDEADQDARTLHDPVEHQPARREPPPLPLLPPPPRYLKYLPRRAAKDGEYSFVDEVLDDMCRDANDPQRDVELRVALERTQEEMDDEAEQEWMEQQAAAAEYQRQRVESMVHIDVDDPRHHSVTAADGVLIVETLSTFHLQVTIALAITCLVLLIILLLLLNLSLDLSICAGDFDIFPIAFAVDVIVQLLAGVLLFAYRQISAQVNVFSELHPFDGEQRLLQPCPDVFE